METVKRDRWGYEVNTSSNDCIASINAYYIQYLGCGRNRSLIMEAPKHDPHCVLANTLAAYFLSSSHPSRSPPYFQAAKNRLEEATSYEKAVFKVITYLVSEGRDDDVAFQSHAKILKDFPKDLVSLKRAQILAFYMGRPDLSLDIVQQVLHVNQDEEYIYGMLAFPLLELGRMEDAEKSAKRGLEINKQDYWAQHNLCHVLQNECGFKEAVEFMEECSSSWSSMSSFMYTHNWWHVALCYLEGNAPIKKVLEIYDQRIWKELERPDAVSGEVYINALGLLLRVYIRDGISVFEDRLKILGGRLTDKSTWYLEWQLDLLTIWALAITGELTKADELLEGLRYRISRMTKIKQQSMQIGILLAESLYEYGRGNDTKALELLGPDFDANNCKIIGASDEQLDVFNEMWFSMLLNTGQAPKAIEVMEKQVKKREGAPFLWRLLEGAYSMTGRPEAAIVGEKATALESAYFKQPA